MENFYKDNLFIDPSRILYFDTETTGLYPELEDILQLSIIDDNGRIRYNSYFHPRVKTAWPEAQRINHITPEMVAHYPSFAQEQVKIQEILDEALVLCGYNIDFDIGFLVANGINFREDVQKVDVLKKARNHLKGISHKLVNVAAYMGFNFEQYPAHDSLGDVFATKYINDYIDMY